MRKTPKIDINYATLHKQQTKKSATRNKVFQLNLARTKKSGHPWYKSRPTYISQIEKSKTNVCPKLIDAVSDKSGFTFITF